jgi:toxin ParE1/3/4
MRVHWTNTAEGHLDAIYDYISQDSPEYARRVVDRLIRRSEQISQFPSSGRRVPEYSSRIIAVQESLKVYDRPLK